MDNDLMSSLMGILNNPETKEKLTGIISDLGNDTSPPEQTVSAPPPAPVPFAQSGDIFSQNGIEAIMRLKTMMEKLNRKDDYRIGLLNSMKPFMKNGRERNIDTAIKFIQIINFASGR